ncbi:hypothetical protein ElyMa_002504300 [Elysia marginata]|uniref:Uncharacterized protein n=1 Tax=Elysia marginata TaxID=1093978 RepID=A0AAV4GRJ9_9GAST|nr:hypothetical protein ElyMa_002504300 [Elysia marginata]
MLEGNFNISVTAVKGNVDLDTVFVTSDMPGIQVLGDCEFYMILVWPNNIMWKITEYSPIYEFTVAFTPYKIFSDLTISALLEVYDSPKKANLLGKYASYKCSQAETHEYVGGNTGELSYRVVVGVQDFQVQVAKIFYGGFGPALHECGTLSRIPSEFPEDTRLYTWLLLLFVVAPLVLVIVVTVGSLLLQCKLFRIELQLVRRHCLLKHHRWDCRLFRSESCPRTSSSK